MPRYLGQYELIKELGSGTYGTVYLASGEVPAKGAAGPKKQLVAIKKLRNPADKAALETLRREFDLLAQVKHRSVCKVYEFLEDESAVVMEHVHGLTVREILDACAQAREPMFAEAAIEVGCEVADCLYQSFSTPTRGGETLQLVHRDIKPENVMLTPQGEVKVLDFGLARVAVKGKNDKRVKGTPLYMAPEQALGKEVDHRTDLFALGLVLFEMLMGKPAYAVPDPSAGGADPVAAVMKRIEKADLRDQLRELESKLPGPGPVVARCLQASPRARYDNGHELMLDLRRHLLKDRGAYLDEFTEYFFQTIRKLEPLPTPDGAGPGNSRPSSVSKPQTPDPGRAEPMSNKPTPPRPSGAPPAAGGPPAGPPRPAAPGAPPGPPRPAAGPPRPAGPPGAPAGARPPAAPPAAPPAGARPGPVPQGGKGVFKPGGDDEVGRPSPKKAKKESSARSPDETGMLQMQALKEEDDERDDTNAPKSATQFFAIPAKKQKKELAPPGPVGQLPPPKNEGTAGRALPGQPSSNLQPLPGLPPPGAPMGGGGMLPPPGSAANMSMMGGAPMAIQGPVAGGGNVNQSMMAGATPFQVGGPQPVGGVPVEENRASSYRVFAIVLGLLAMAFMVMVIGVAAVVIGTTYATTPDKPKETVAETPHETHAPHPVQDTGTKQASPDPQKPKAPKKPKAQGTTTTTVAETPKAPPPPPPAAKGPVTVKIGADQPFTGIEISKCGDFREQAKFSGGTATVSDVPTSGDCTINFKGGPPAMFRPVHGGQTWNCTFVGATASCKQ